MKKHHCLLLSLIRPLITNSKDSNGHHDTKGYTISIKDVDEAHISPSLFYESEPNNYGFVAVDGKVRKVKFDELNLDLSAVPKTNHIHDYLCFSNSLSDTGKAFGKYQLEKGTIIWKIKDEEFKK